MNYVEEGISFGCARTMPGELQAALVVLETAGRIAEPDQLSRDPTWLAHLQSWKSDLDGQKVSRGSAKTLFSGYSHCFGIACCRYR